MKTLKRTFSKAVYLASSTLLIASLFAAILISATPASAEGGYSWTDQTSAGSRSWPAIASSTDGKKLAAVVNGGDIYTSTDSGATWVDQTSTGALHNLGWSTVASSADGTKLAVGDYNYGYIYTSTDSGHTWTTRASIDNTGYGDGINEWQSIASSADGTRLAAVSMEDAHVYTSTDSGHTWTTRTTVGNNNGNWQSIASSSDGTKLVAVDEGFYMAGGYGGGIFTSNDSGVNWTNQTPAGYSNWSSVTSSADGSKLAATKGALGSAGYISTSTDSGVNWTDQISAGAHTWSSITSSADGSKLAAVDGGWDVDTSSYTSGYIYTSTDSGASWTKQTTAGVHTWSSITSSADGSKLAAVAYGGDIYTAYNPALDTSIPTTFPNATNQAPVFLIHPAGTTLTSHSAVNPTTLPNDIGSGGSTSSASTAGSGSSSSSSSSSPTYTYPLGLVDFALTAPLGSTQPISLTFETDLHPNQVTARKYNPNTKQYSNVPGATITATTLNGKPALLLTYIITDGGPLDTDGTANGTILDPVGLALGQAPTAAKGLLADTGENTTLIATVALLMMAGGVVLTKRYNAKQFNYKG